MSQLQVKQNTFAFSPSQDSPSCLGGHLVARTSLTMALSWEEIAQAKREYRDNSIPKEWRLQAGQVPDGRLNVLEVPVECGILTPREIEITEADAVMLVQKIIERKFSSYEVSYSQYN